MSPYEHQMEQARQRRRAVLPDGTGCPLRVDPVERAVSNSPPECPDLDQGPTNPDELAARARQETAQLLMRRGDTHGNFADNARIAQELRTFFRAERQWLSLSPREREALDMIAGKLSRILSSGRGMKEHWEDVAGYATLAATPEIQKCATPEIQAGYAALAATPELQRWGESAGFSPSK